jgi:hypothetical protein
MGIWCEVKPLSPKRSKHQWIFALYTESPSERVDRLWYVAFLFRNEAGSVFGLREQLGDDALKHFHEYRAIATRILNDKEFRSSLISDDPDLPRMWKRHLVPSGFHMLTF